MSRFPSSRSWRKPALSKFVDLSDFFEFDFSDGPGAEQLFVVLYPMLTVVQECTILAYAGKFIDIDMATPTADFRDNKFNAITDKIQHISCAVIDSSWVATS